MTPSGVVLAILMGFMCLGALDRVFTQCGGAERVLSTVGLGFLGKQIAGGGAEFEEGFNAMGALSLGMIGIIALAPVLADFLGDFLGNIYAVFGASPAMFAGTLLACDTGGFPLALRLAEGDLGAGMYSGVMLSSTLGATIIFIIPVGLGIVSRDDVPHMAKGILAGLVTVPIACIAGGLVAMWMNISIDGEPVIFTVSMILKNMIPVIIFAGIIIVGLKFASGLMVRCFSIFSRGLIVLITIALSCAVLQDIFGVVLLPGMDPIFSVGDGELRAFEIVGKIACLLLGAYPMVFYVTRWFGGVLTRAGRLLALDKTGVAGLIACSANIIPMFALVKDMNVRGKVVNMAFAVSGGFILGDHLGFIAAVAPAMVLPLLVTKFVGGVTAVGLAMALTPQKDAIGTGTGVLSE